ncbi:MAG: RNA pyrophosphohydrolase [Gammaproteobacteria bacterium]|nr:RNA pyrophosphohydrolase [Gammaproteobacteria bacterium]
MFADDGYRPNVGIIICNDSGQVFWARRVKRDGWQFPQGGVSREESLLDAMYRELEEETGLQRQQVDMVAHTSDWLHYDLPAKYLRGPRNRMHRKRKVFKGQKQVWFLLKLLADDSAVNLAAGLDTPEFDTWRWVEADFALQNIVDFKRQVYRRALQELSTHLPHLNVSGDRR